MVFVADIDFERREDCVGYLCAGVLWKGDGDVTFFCVDVFEEICSEEADSTDTG